MSYRLNYRRRSTRRGLLEYVRGLGFRPKTIIDVGSAYGRFASEAELVFPDAGLVLIEPLGEYESLQVPLKRTSRKRIEYIKAVASSQSGEMYINVHPDWEGSSIFLEEEDSNVNGVQRKIPSVTLDSLQQEYGLDPPFLLKIDVQGAELEVLRGGEQVLRESEYILLEVSCFEFFKGGPLFNDVVKFMGDRGFVVFDVCDLQYRPLDGALSQLDLAFVKETGSFRMEHYYATREQRESRNRKFVTASARLNGLKNK